MIQTDKFNKKMAEMIRSLGHPARIEILILLENNSKKKMTVTQIYEQLGLTQPETSRHLSVLKNSSVLLCEKNGANAYYYINEKYSFISCVTNYMNKQNNTGSE